MELVTVNISGKGRYVTWQDRFYFVAPLTMIVPGVLNGSRGPLLYPYDEVRKDPAAWNGMPMVAGHPVISGRHVSARDPFILERYGLGNVYRTSVKNSLDAQGWFDVMNTRRVDGRVLDALEQGKPIELSTGLYTENVPAPEGSVYNGRDKNGNAYSRPYVAIARNYRPDHLAILMDTVGACSTKDGCGVQVVNGSSVIPLPLLDHITSRQQELGVEALKQNKEHGFLTPDWVVNEELWDKATEAAVKGNYSEQAYWAVVSHIYQNLGGVVGVRNANPNQPRNDKGRYDHAHRVALQSAARVGFSELTSYGHPTQTPPQQQTQDDPLSPVSTEQDTEEQNRHSPKAVFGADVIANDNLTQGDVTMPLTDAQRKGIIDGLTANCGCPATKATRITALNAKTDGELMSMDECKKWADSQTNNQGIQLPDGSRAVFNDATRQWQVYSPAPVQNQQVQQPVQNVQQPQQPAQVIVSPVTNGQPSQNPAQPQQTGTPSQPAQPATPQSGVPVVNQWGRPSSLEDALKQFGTPEEQAVWNASVQIYNANKAAVIQQLTANISDPNERQQRAQWLGTKSLEELKAWQGMLPPPAQNVQQPQAPVHNWLGSSVPTAAVQQPVTEEPLVAPVYNFAKAG